VDVLVRPEDMTLAPALHGRGIVTTRMFLGGITRVTVRLDGDVSVLVDQPSAAAAELAVGASVEVAITGRVLVADRT
jgi:putative spermidine/putrescine transport system ATP-binding protein